MKLITLAWYQITLAIITMIGAKCTRRSKGRKNEKLFEGNPLGYTRYKGFKVSAYEKINKKLQNFACSEVLWISEKQNSSG
jgi:hypothetical protein